MSVLEPSPCRIPGCPGTRTITIPGRSGSFCSTCGFPWEHLFCPECHLSGEGIEGDFCPDCRTPMIGAHPTIPHRETLILATLLAFAVPRDRRAFIDRTLEGEGGDLLLTIIQSYAEGQLPVLNPDDVGVPANIEVRWRGCGNCAKRLARATEFDPVMGWTLTAAYERLLDENRPLTFILHVPVLDLTWLRYESLCGAIGRSAPWPLRVSLPYPGAPSGGS